MLSITSLSFSADWFLSQTLALHSFPSSVSPRLAVLVFCFPILLSPGLLFAAPSLLPFPPPAVPPQEWGGRALLLLPACVLGHHHDHEAPQLQV